jgi:Flp pilus assembly protein TadD
MNSFVKEMIIRPRVMGLLLALITLAVYLPAVHYDFIDYDDSGYVYENRVVQNGLTWSGVKWAFTADVAGNWHPLTMLSLMLDCELFGLNAGMQHLVNVLFHAANVFLLLTLLFRLTSALWPSAIIAALFAWHPLHVESVAWISERKDVLSTFFELLALLSYASYVKEKRRTSFWLMLTFFALGLLSKPMLVTLPFVLLLLDYWPLQRFPNFKFESATTLRLVLEKWPFFLLAMIFCAVTFLAQHDSGAVMALDSYPFGLRLENALLSYGRYLAKTIWPVHLALIYPLGYSDWLPVAATAMMAALLAVTWLVWRARIQFPYLLVGWFWFLGTLVPVIGLVQIGSQALADRYTYFPLIGIFIAVVFGIKDLMGRFQVGIALPIAAAGLVLAGCLILTERQLSYWRNSETLFRHVIAVTKNNPTAHLNLAMALADKGQQSDALGEYRAALAIQPELQLAHNNLAVLLNDMGRTHEALLQLQEAMNLAPHDAGTHLNLGMLLAKLDRLDEATNQFAQAAQLDPKNPKPVFQMGRVLLLQGHDAEALSDFRQALSLNQKDFNQKDFEMLVYLARVLASDEDAKIRNGSIALAMAAEANDLTRETQPMAFDAMAMAYAEIGQFSEAQKAGEYAIKLATAYNQKEYAAEMKQRLELYKKKQPYRQTFAKTPANVPPENLPKN